MSPKSILLMLAGVCVIGVAYTTLRTDTPALPSSSLTTIGLDAQTDDDIRWMSWDEAIAANKVAPKHMIIDVYTDWCGWCKRMDATTFKDPRVVKYITDNFYAVKFDAEQKADIVYDGNTFSYQKAGNRGVHALAASLLDNRLSYPSIVYFNNKMERVMISPGFKDADAVLAELAQVKG